jgi:hypothetical protein
MAVVTFSKNLIVKYDHATYPSDTVNHLSRTYNDKVVDNTGAAAPTQVSVYFNGQKIPMYISGGTTSFAKYYYTVTINTSAPTVQIDMYSNSGYVNTDYTGMSPVNYTITPEDMFFITYLYEVTI